MLRNIKRSYQAFSIAYAVSFLVFFIIEAIKETSPKEA